MKVVRTTKTRVEVTYAEIVKALQLGNVEIRKITDTDVGVVMVELVETEVAKDLEQKGVLSAVDSTK